MLLNKTYFWVILVMVNLFAAMFSDTQCLLESICGPRFHHIEVQSRIEQKVVLEYVISGWICHTAELKIHFKAVCTQQMYTVEIFSFGRKVSYANQCQCQPLNFVFIITFTLQISRQQTHVP